MDQSLFKGLFQSGQRINKILGFSSDNVKSFYKLPSIFSRLHYFESVDNLDLNLDVDHYNSILLRKDLSNAKKLELVYDELKVVSMSNEIMYQDISVYDYLHFAFAFDTVFEEADDFIILKLDVSGIQDFIFNIQSKGALKNLRSRSFFLDFIIEYINDELLAELGYDRANIIYSGGGNSYILVGDTDHNKNKIDRFMISLNQWLLESFEDALFVSYGYYPVNDEAFKDSSAHAEIFRNLNLKIDRAKGHRYSLEEIEAYLNRDNGTLKYECLVCGINVHKKDSECTWCSFFTYLSEQLIKPNINLVITETSLNSDSIEIFGFKKKRYLSLLTNISNESLIRYYSLNRSDRHPASIRLNIANYSGDKSLQTLVETDKGIQRLGVFKADIDDLGKAFIEGFSYDNNKFASFVRTSILSRELNDYFKVRLPKLIQSHNLANLIIIFAGGDDLFIVGQWQEIMELSLVLRKDFEEYTMGRLTISAGIGLYHAKYPIIKAANETENLLDAAKNYSYKDYKKNAVCIFEESNIFAWDQFRTNVIEDKLHVIENYMNNIDLEYGSSIIYKLLDLLKDMEQPVNYARYAYYLSRLETRHSKQYQVFSDHMIEYVQGSRSKDNDHKELIMALVLYVYQERRQ